MPGTVSPIPQGYHSITSALTCKNAEKAIDFYKQAFGATEIMRMAGPGGSIGHAELRIGDSVIFVSDEFPGMSAAPVSGALPASYLFLYTADVDATFERALAAGATESMPVTNMFWGDRYGKVTDPFGHTWGVATHVEDVAPAEMERRAAEWQANMAKAAAAGQS
ncbi:MAG TPA: VOC family protein [Candidatus Acidoferrum sp.]|nr:VOC family protein [Candidatus Acidoferrum sp.]